MLGLVTSLLVLFFQTFLPIPAFGTEGVGGCLSTFLVQSQHLWDLEYILASIHPLVKLIISHGSLPNRKPKL